MIIKITADNFNDEVINKNGKILVDFYADWCGPCKMISPIIEEIANEYPEISVCKVNVDVTPEFAIRYNVVSIPTLILFENGNVKDMKVGLVGKDTILKMFS